MYALRRQEVRLWSFTVPPVLLSPGMSRCLLKLSKRSLRIEIYAASAI